MLPLIERIAYLEALNVHDSNNSHAGYWQSAYEGLKREFQRQSCEIEALKHEIAKYEGILMQGSIHANQRSPSLSVHLYFLFYIVVPTRDVLQSLSTGVTTTEDVIAYVSVNEVNDLLAKLPELEESKHIIFQSSSLDVVEMFLTAVQSLKMSRFVIRNTVLTMCSFQKVCRLLYVSKTLERFELMSSGEVRPDGSTWINKEIVAILCKALNRSTVRTFSITECKISADGIPIFVELINTNIFMQVTLESRYEKMCQAHLNFAELRNRLSFV